MQSSSEQLLIGGALRDDPNDEAKESRASLAVATKGLSFL